MIETTLHRVRSIRVLPVVTDRTSDGVEYSCRHIHIDTERETIGLILFGTPDGLEVRVMEAEVLS
jgi:hypothetical protein